MPDHPPQTFFDKLQATVTMRPRWVFWLEHASIAAAIIFVAIGLVYVGSLVSFIWRSSQFSSLPAFGAEGYGVLFRVFPWWYMVFIVLGAAALIYLARNHTKLYRWPIVGTVGVFLLAFISAAAIADTTHFHDRLTNRDMAGQMIPFIGGVYRGQEPLTQGIITAATVTKVNGKTLTVISGPTTLKVKISSQTHLPDDWQPAVGDQIVVIGKRDRTTITAIAIHPARDLPNRQPFRIFDDGGPMSAPSY